MTNRVLLLLCILLVLSGWAPSLVFAADPEADAQPPRTIAGYKGIWFELGQKSKHGDKYSGGLGTYTAKHHPLAVYAPEVNKTFFVYGGTTAKDKRHLLAMVSYYDHKKHQVPRPVVVHDKQGVDDPHDNPSLQIDRAGHLWVFVSGRGKTRPGHIYRSSKPYDITSFKHVAENEFTYPQPWFNKHGGVLLFTKYTKGRELYWRTSDAEAKTWNKDIKLAGMGGHYQMSNQHNGKLITAFNMHPGGNVNLRTNLYFVQTDDRGKTWRTVGGKAVNTPISDPKSAALVRDYRAEDRLVYLKDIGFDAKGNPALLYITASHHQPGPKGDPRMWTIAHWTGSQWLFHDVTRSTHNYDMGSLYIEADDRWRIIAPTQAGPQPLGTGGEIAVWTSDDQGKTWRKQRDVTRSSPHNHGYVRRPVHAHHDFYGFWADGDADQLSESRLYFTNKTGDQVWALPYDMDEPFAEPELITK
jgi:hypothetical protein